MNNNIGPAQFFLQRTATGGLPSHMESKGIKFRQDPELPEGVSRRSLPIVDSGTLKQGQPIAVVTQEQQYPVKGGSSLGRQIDSRFRNTGSCRMTEPGAPLTRNPPPNTTSDIGPAQFFLQRTAKGGLPSQLESKGIRFRQDPDNGVSRRSFPVVDEGTLRQGVPTTLVSPQQQYPIPSESSLGPQVLSRYKNTGSCRMTEPGAPLTRNPAPEQTSDVGPAQFFLQRTAKGGLPSHMESKGIKFRQDKELPEGFSRRALPIVDQGTVKQGAPIAQVDPYQQYPCREYSSLRLVKVNSRRRSETQSRKSPEVLGGAGTQGFGKSSDKLQRTMTKRELEKKGKQLFNLSMPRNTSISDWLESRGGELKSTEGLGKFAGRKPKPTYESPKKAVEAIGGRDGKKKINSIADWLETHQEW